MLPKRLRARFAARTNEQSAVREYNEGDKKSAMARLPR